jgi:hypothetical protein
MTTTCPDCGKQFADDVLHPCRAGNIWLGNAPAETLEVRAPVPNDTADATGGLTFTQGLHLPPPPPQ